MCVEGRSHVLANQAAFTAFKNAAAKLREWTVLFAILMPDHVHVIVTPISDRDAKVGNFSAAIKRWMRQELKAAWRWQPGSFDRLLRSEESLHDKWLYVEEIQCGEVSWIGGKIGPIVTSSTIQNCRASAPLALQNNDALLLPPKIRRAGGTNEAPALPRTSLTGARR
jgi:hypothetical protein